METVIRLDVLIVTESGLTEEQAVIKIMEAIQTGNETINITPISYERKVF